MTTDFTSPSREAYRSLRTALQFSTEEGVPKALLVTSSRPGEGKSTAAACLAVNFAQLGMRVLLIDGDLRNPSMHTVMGVENGAGLTNYLAGANEASDLVKPSGTEGLTLLTSGPRPPNPAELLASPRFASLLTTAAESFDVVIVDGPPILGLADAPIIASVASGTLLVIEANCNQASRRARRAQTTKLRACPGARRPPQQVRCAQGRAYLWPWWLRLWRRKWGRRNVRLLQLWWEE